MPTTVTSTRSIPHVPAPTEPRTVKATDLRRWLQDGNEIALLDVREHGEYGEGHPFLSVSLPYSRLEIDIGRLVPRLDTRIVLLDNGDDSRLADRAADRLRALGYSGVHQLAGGVATWPGTGAALFKGVNLPSKTFGEEAERAWQVPHISAAELRARLQSGEPLVLLDGRTLEEHRKMTIPGALPVPNGELALRWRSVVPNDTVPIVVHCAGRTRSIVGAQILRDLGVPNPVVALENGTQGWALAGFALEHGSDRALPAVPDAAAREAARADAETAARREDVPTLGAAAAQAWVDDARHTTYALDVRTATEFRAGHLAGSASAPGGQLLQATDLSIGVRGSRVLVLDDDNVRAPLAALWLRRLGFEAALVSGGIGARLSLPKPRRFQPAPLPLRHTAELVAIRAGTDGRTPPVLIDLRASQVHRRGHPQGALWSIRPRLVADVRQATQGDTARAVLIVFDEPDVAALAATDLREAGWTDVSAVLASQADEAGWPREVTPQSPSDADAIDYLLFVHDRHDGNLDAARRYLEWETGLLAQCTADELAIFRLPVPVPAPGQAAA